MRAETSERRPDKLETAPTTNVIIVATKRRCEGPFCWCHVGDIVVPVTHDQAMTSMARRIRELEIDAGVLGVLGAA